MRSGFPFSCKRSDCQYFKSNPRRHAVTCALRLRPAGADRRPGGGRGGRCLPASSMTGSPPFRLICRCGTSKESAGEGACAGRLPGVCPESAGGRCGLRLMTPRPDRGDASAARSPVPERPARNGLHRPVSWDLFPGNCRRGTDSGKAAAGPPSPATSAGTVSGKRLPGNAALLCPSPGSFLRRPGRVRRPSVVWFVVRGAVLLVGSPAPPRFVCAGVRLLLHQKFP